MVVDVHDEGRELVAGIIRRKQEDQAWAEYERKQGAHAPITRERRPRWW